MSDGTVAVQGGVDIGQVVATLRDVLAAAEKPTQAGCPHKLSQSDLVLCANHLSEQIHLLKGQVYEAIGLGYDEFIKTFDDAAHVERAISDLSNKLAGITRQIEDPRTGVNEALIVPALELERLSRQDELTTHAIQTVAVLKELSDRINAFSRALDAFALPTAAKITREIGQLIDRLPAQDGTGDVPSVIITIRKRHVRRCDRLKKKLSELVRQALVFDSTSISYKSQIHIHLNTKEAEQQTIALSPSDIFSAMDELHEEPNQSFLSKEMEGFVCNSLRKGILHHLLLHTFSGQRWDILLDEGDHKEIRIAEKKDPPVESTCKSDRTLSVEQLFKVLGNLFTLLASKVFTEQPIRAMLGRLLWEPLCQDIIAAALSPAIPSDTTELAKYQGETIECASKFEDLMIELGIVVSEVAERRLSRFINNIDNHFAIKKQKKILSRARALLLNTEANACLKEVCTSNLLPDVSAFLSFRPPTKSRTSSTSKRNAPRDAPSVSGSARSMLESEEDKEEEGLLRIASQASHLSSKGQDDKETSTFLFNMPKCQVSASTIGLIILAHHTLEEACRLRDAAPQCAITLLQTARYLFDMFRAIMPLQYQKETIRSVPSLMMAFYNDCFFIALHLLTFGIQYQARLPHDKGPFTFVDMVPLFRQLGEQQYQEQYDKQKSVLRETLHAAHGLGDTHLRARYTAVERALKRIMHHLTHLSRVWKDVLPRHIYLHTLGSLVDAVLEHLIADFKKLSDISEEETHHLHELLSLLLSCPAFFTITDESGGVEQEESAGSNVPQSFGDVDNGQDHIKKHVSKWTKFVKIVNILNSKLVIIVDAFVKGLMPEFEAEELKAIIRALFSDSPLRKSQLALIK